jgi:hypothetical protein
LGLRPQDAQGKDNVNRQSSLKASFKPMIQKLRVGTARSGHDPIELQRQTPLVHSRKDAAGILWMSGHLN